jgi:hypothetical protein
MKKTILSLVMIVLFLAFVENSSAQTQTQSQTLTMTVPSMFLFAVTSGAIGLAPTYNPTAQNPFPITAQDASSSYQFRSNSTTIYRIYGKISADMPAGTKLTVNLSAAPVGTSTGASAGNRDLTSSDQDCVTGLTGTVNGTITYTFEIANATVTPGAINQTVTWTVGP